MPATPSRSSRCGDSDLAAAGSPGCLPALTTPELAALLRQGQSERAILDALGERCKRRFRSAWHFLDWAGSNGVDPLK